MGVAKRPRLWVVSAAFLLGGAAVHVGYRLVDARAADRVGAVALACAVGTPFAVGLVLLSVSIATADLLKTGFPISAVAACVLWLLLAAIALVATVYWLPP